jgi:putative membrane-bound dehydrogenase-like protein
MMACFDDRGRLFVTEAAGVNMNADDLLKNRPNSIRMLEDIDGDGTFDKSTVFADKMTLPMGACWHDGALYVASPPSIWKLEDTNGDGVADKRTELVTKFGFNGNGADIHGPFIGPDGWLYWTDGRHGHEIHTKNGALLKGEAARIFRCRPNGSDVEVVCGGGMDNPVEIAFTEEGEPLATANIFESRPRRVDAIFYAIEGGVFPYADVVREFKRTGDLLPAVGELGWVAVSGLTRYRDSAFGQDFTNNLFSAQFNTHRIQRHVVNRAGASFSVTKEDFLTSASTDFHPTDVLEDADGSLLVIDTGGWFRIGCPTSQIAKPEIKGGIYRIRRKDMTTPADPRGLQIKWNQLNAPELIQLLDDPRFAVRGRAVEQLAKLGPQAIGVLREGLNNSASLRLRRNIVWALSRIQSAEAAAALLPALQDKEMSVRLAAAHVVGLNRDLAATERLIAMTSDDHPAIRRQAATSLGRIRQPQAVPALLAQLRNAEDRFLQHAVIYALIQIADGPATSAGLKNSNWRVRQGALVALHQMDGSPLTAEIVAPLLNDTEPAIQKAAWTIATAQPAWAPGLAPLLRRWMREKDLTEQRLEYLREAILAFSKDAGIQALASESLRENLPNRVKLMLLETMAQAPLEQMPPAWIADLGHALQDDDAAIVRQAVATVRTVGISELDAPLRLLARDQDRPAELRLGAFAAIAPRLFEVAEKDLEFLKAQLDRKRPAIVRLLASKVIGTAPIYEQQLIELLPTLAAAGPLEMPNLLAAYEHSGNLIKGQKLLKALESSPALLSISPETLKRTLRIYPKEVQDESATLLKRLTVDAQAQKARLAELEPVLHGGEAKHGREVFFSQRGACSTCHTIGTEGGRIGPDLSHIASIRSPRDLLESVVFPSASFARGYEPYTIVTRDGQIHAGIIARETPEAVYLNTPDEERIFRSRIEAIRPGRLSTMPQGLDAQMSAQELADLIAFLASLR